MFKPFAGQIFATVQEAEDFYKSYAQKEGFSVRLGKIAKDGEGHIKKREFYCHRRGVTPKKIFKENESNRPSTRTDCKALLRVSVQKKEGTENWAVRDFANDHNHDFAG